MLHAINYLPGRLDRSYLPRLREFGGLQPYPSRTKDPDPVDYSTGSVGIGATGPGVGAGAFARRYTMNVTGWTEARMLSRYQHVVDELRRDAADRMGEALWPPEE